MIGCLQFHKPTSSVYPFAQSFHKNRKKLNKLYLLLINDKKIIFFQVLYHEKKRELYISFKS